jgi:hypothetical protein
LDSSLELVDPANGSPIARTGHYANPSSYRREGAAQRLEVDLRGVRTTQHITSTAPDRAELAVAAESSDSAPRAELVLVSSLERALLAGGRVDARTVEGARVELSSHTGSDPAREVAAPTTVVGLAIVSPQIHYELEFDEPLEVSLTPRAEPARVDLRITLGETPPTPGARIDRRIRIAVGGVRDHTEARISIDTARPGRRFDGVGGNFRLQFPDTDPAAVDYTLRHLPVRWARVCMWWTDWDPLEDEDPLERVRRGEQTDRQRRQLELTRRLHLAGLPIIVATWDPPPWAVTRGVRRPGTYGDPLAPEKRERAAASIAAYLQHLRESYGVEAVWFSFNEPDIGVNMPQTPDEHAAMVALLGATFAERRLPTRMLVADTSNATAASLQFVHAVLAHPEARRYAGAIGFHTWGGVEPQNLAAWDNAAHALGVPLHVTEGGPDAEAHRHPDLFREPAYALAEIDLYVRLCAFARPVSIQHWQLTADYSLLDGGGTYGRSGPLTPTWRFWNFKQLGSVPEGSFALPVRVGHDQVTAAAFHHVATDRFAVHIVNRGAARRAVVDGLPLRDSTGRVWASTAEDGMRDLGAVSSRGGRLEVELPAAAFVTVVTDAPTPD